MGQGRNAETGTPAEEGQGRRRAGRPRLRPASDAKVAPREEILDAAAELFVGQGFATTTTRQIAERVGIRQASLYYYFHGKDEILLELLTQSVRPSLRVAAELESRCRHEPTAALYALALIDVRTLTQAPHNIATLYLAPEVQGEEFKSFRAERAQLQATYGRLGQAAAGVSPGAASASGSGSGSGAASGSGPGAASASGSAGLVPAAGGRGDAGSGGDLDEALTATLIMQVVESVIQLRRAGELRDGYGHQIAAACLRLAGLGAGEITRARAAAENLLASLSPPPA